MNVECAVRREEELIGRRVATRHCVDLAARFVDSESNIRVQLENVSATGACLRLMRPRRLTAGRLNWLNYKAFGQVIWQDDLRFGLLFADPLGPECLDKTIDFGERLSNDPSGRYLRLASAWMHGPGDF